MSQAQTVSQSPESVKAIGLSVAEALLPSFTALREDKDDRHAVRNSAETALSLATVAATRIDTLEKRVDALLGDGTGENGKLAVMGQTIRKTEDAVNRIENKLDSLSTLSAKLETNTNKSNSFMDGWKGALMAGTVALMCLSIIAGIVGLLVKIYK